MYGSRCISHSDRRHTKAGFCDHIRIIKSRQIKTDLKITGIFRILRESVLTVV